MQSPTNSDQRDTPTSIHDHMFWTYVTLRLGMAVLAFIFPALLYVVGKAVYGLDLQNSMSAYFFASSVEKCTQFPMRTFFVGLLFAIGSFLYLYKGITWKENWALNIAGAAALLVAIFPESVSPTDPRLAQLPPQCRAIVDLVISGQGEWPVHGASAAALFIGLAYVAIWRAPDTLKYLPDRPQPKGVVRFFYQIIGSPEQQGFRVLYRVIGLLMLASPAIAFLLNVVFTGPTGSSYVFFVELAGVWCFAAYWAVKSIELSLSRADESLLLVQRPETLH